MTKTKPFIKQTFRLYILLFYKYYEYTFSFIIKVFRTIVFIFIVISTTFWPICPPAFFRCLSNSGTFTELRTTSFIETTGVACSDSTCHNRVQVLSIPVYCSPKRCGNNNKDEDNSLKNLNEKYQHASSQKFRHTFSLFLTIVNCHSFLCSHPLQYHPWDIT